MAYSGPYPLPIVGGGTNAITMATTNGVVYFNGTGLVTTAVGTSGQVLTSNGVGLAPTFQASGGGGGGASTFHTGTGDAIVAAGAITITGTAPISTTGSGSTVTIALAIPVTVANGGTGRITLTNHGVLIGATAAAITQLAVGTNGQVLLGSSAADPVFGTLTSSGSISFTTGAGTLAINVAAPLTVPNGGTGRTTLTNHGLLVGATTTAITQLAVGATGTLLQGNTGADPSFTSSPSVSGSVTAGTSITATNGNVVITAGNLNLANSDLTGNIGYITLGGNRHFSNFGTNLLIGNLAGNLTLSATGCTGVGTQVFFGLGSGSNNDAFGNSTLIGLTSGGDNLALGGGSGGAYTNENSNILIKNPGTVGDANAIRIGFQGGGAGQQNKCFIAGIFGVTTGVTGIPVVVDNAGQLGTVVSSSRFKENILVIKDSNKIYDLRPVIFNYKSDVSKTKQIGLIAEEVAEYFPEMVVYDHEGLPFTIKYQDLSILLLVEIKKLRTRIEVLEKNIT